MKDSRIGESLWSIWDGLGYTSAYADSIIYSTTGHVDVEHELVKRALASSIQREGIAYSLGESFRLVDQGVVSWGWVGIARDELEETICSESGESEDGSMLSNVAAMTFVEVPNND